MRLMMRARAEAKAAHAALPGLALRADPHARCRHCGGLCDFQFVSYELGLSLNLFGISLFFVVHPGDSAPLVTAPGRPKMPGRDDCGARSQRFGARAPVIANHRQRYGTARPAAAQIARSVECALRGMAIPVGGTMPAYAVTDSAPACPLSSVGEEQSWEAPLRYESAASSPSTVSQSNLLGNAERRSGVDL
jgi:hypothetical protein